MNRTEQALLKRIACFAILFAVCAAATIGAATPSGGALAGERMRLIVESDIGGSDPDDEQSMVHLLVYADLFDIEGIIVGPPGGRKSTLDKVINAYEKDYPKVKTYSSKYPTPDYLRSISVQGKTSKGFGSTNAASKLIVAAAKKSDSRPLWITHWGSMTNTGIALRDAPEIAGKLRMHSIGAWNKTNGDTEVNNWVRDNCPKATWIVNRRTFRGMYMGGYQSGDYSNTGFISTHVKGHGALGNYYFNAKSSLKEGDTPSWMYLLAGNPGNPGSEHWGGKYKNWSDIVSGDRTDEWSCVIDNRPNFWSDISRSDATADATVNKWRKNYLDDWKARMDRCTEPSSDDPTRTNPSGMQQARAGALRVHRANGRIHIAGLRTNEHCRMCIRDLAGRTIWSRSLRPAAGTVSFAQPNAAGARVIDVYAGTRRAVALIPLSTKR
jgi:hypothetical protein